MTKIYQWRKERWFKNLLFLVLILFISFSEFPLWVNIWFTQNDLDQPSFELTQAYGDAVNLKTVNLIDKNGGFVNLSMFEGQPIFINFFQSWCVPCLAEFESMQKLKSQMPEVQFVFISAEGEDDFYKFVSKAKVDLPYFNLNSGIPRELSHKTIPTSFLLDKRGVIVFRHYAAADWSEETTVTKLKELIL